MFKNEPERSRGSVLAILILVAALAVAGAMMLGVALDNDPSRLTTIGRGGGRRTIPWEQARWIWGPLGASTLLLSLWLGIRTIAALRGRPAARTRRSDGLKLGEAIRWSGRSGLRGLQLRHLLVAIALLLCALPVLLSLLWIWRGPMAAGTGWFILSGQIFSTLVVLLVFGRLAVIPIWFVLMRDNHWLHELSGSVLITDRRLLWRSALGRIAHTIPGEAIEDIVLATDKRGREEIHLRVRTHKAKVEDRVLRGFRDSAGATTALQLIARPPRH